MVEFEVRYAIVFKEDGFNETGVRELLEPKYGKITEITDDTLVADDGDETPVKIVYMTTPNIGTLFKVQLDLHCVRAKDSPYVFFPMNPTEYCNMLWKRAMETK